MDEFLLGLAVLLASIVIHENAHGVTALILGDDTAKKAGRLTLNPVKHLDLVGSLILPAAMYFSMGAMFGYAKPVPVVPAKLRGTDRTGFAMVAAAGPLSNFLIAYGAAIWLRVTEAPVGGFTRTLIEITIVWNVLLAAFNLLPLPPLDGSRMLRLFLGTEGRRKLDQFEPYGFLVLFLMIVLLRDPLLRVIDVMMNAIFRLLPL